MSATHRPDRRAAHCVGRCAVAFSQSPCRQTVARCKGDDADWFRDGFAQRTISACLPARGKGSHPARQADRLDTQRHTIENRFGRLKGWRRLALRDDRCAHTVFLCHLDCLPRLFFGSHSRVLTLGTTSTPDGREKQKQDAKTSQHKPIGATIRANRMTAFKMTTNGSTRVKTGQSPPFDTAIAVLCHSAAGTEGHRIARANAV